MIKFFKKIFGLEEQISNNRVQDVNNEVIYLEQNEVEEEQYPKLILKKPPACSYCQSLEHNIKTCVEMNQQLDSIKTYCIESLNSQNVIKLTTYLNTYNEKVLQRYINIKKIDSYMFNNCVEYYNGNISELKGKDKYIQLIIGYEHILPLHPEIRIKRVYKKRVTESKPVKHPSNAVVPSDFLSGVATGAVLTNNAYLIADLYKK